MASAYLTRTVTASTATSYTVSFWVKINNINDSNTPYFWSIGSSAGNGIYFDTDGKIDFFKQSTASYLTLYDGALRDPSGWTHVVWSVNAGTGTAYVNGVTGNSHSSIPALNDNTGTKINIHSYVTGAYNTLDCCMAHFHFIDGTAYNADTFGESDSVSGIWKPKTSPSVTYGSNGFFLKFENSGAMGTDSSGNGNNFTVSGNFTQNVDTPSNVFATLNKLSTHSNNSLTNGSLTIGFNANISYTNSIGTLGINSGRWYVEAKIAGATTYYPCIGFCSMGNNTRRYYDPLYTASHLGADEGTGYFAHGNIQKNGSTDGDYATFTTGDIISMYLDLESGTKTMKYYKNDSLIKSTTITPVDGQFYTFGATGTTGSDIVNFNFGSGFFGTTAVASGNADANGFGSFEYSPTLSGVNYYALCTKNIKDYG
jgi:hypothetical protein